MTSANNWQGGHAIASAEQQVIPGAGCVTSGSAYQWNTTGGTLLPILRAPRVWEAGLDVEKERNTVEDEGSDEDDEASQPKRKNSK